MILKTHQAHTAAKSATAIPASRPVRDPWPTVAVILWNLPVIAAGILVGAILALFLGLFFDWINIAC